MNTYSNEQHGIKRIYAGAKSVCIKVGDFRKSRKKLKTWMGN